MSLRAQRSNLPCRELRLLRRCAPPKKLTLWVARPNWFDRARWDTSPRAEDTLKLRLGVPPGARRRVSFSHPPPSGSTTRNDIFLAGRNSPYHRSLHAPTKSSRTP